MRPKDLMRFWNRDYSPGRPPRLSQEQQELLRAELEKPEGFSSYQQITDYISETFDVQMNYKTVHALIRYKWNAKLKVPRKSHEKKTKKRVIRSLPTSRQPLRT